MAFFSDGDRYDGMVEILQQHPGTYSIFKHKHRPGTTSMMGTGNIISVRIYFRINILVRTKLPLN